MKFCTRCGQEIQDAAIKCRYCQNWLIAPPAGLEAQPTQIVIRQSSTNGMAIASMVLGLLWIYWIGSILALFFGYAARREIRRNPDSMDGDGMALAGIVLGWLGVAMLALTIGWLVYIYKVSPEQPNVRETKTTASCGAPACHSEHRRFLENLQDSA